MKAVLIAAAVLCATPACADPISYTVTGVIAPIVEDFAGETTGTDGGGFFGPAGGSIIGDRYTVVWTANNCGCTGAGNSPFAPASNSFPLPDPILDVTLTINGITFDFGAPDYYGEFYLPGEDPINLSLNLQQAAYLHGNDEISTSVGFALDPSVGGAFEINETDDTSKGTAGVFGAQAVPGPLAGAGLPGLIFASGGLLTWWRRKRKAVS